MTSAPAIGFEYRPSRQLKYLLLGMAGLALLAIALCALMFGLKLLLWIIVLLATWRSARRLSDRFIVAAGWSSDGSWVLHTDEHDDLPATLLSFRVLSGWVLLRLKTVERTQVLLLAPDNSDTDIRRRMRVRLATMQAKEALPRI